MIIIQFGEAVFFTVALTLEQWLWSLLFGIGDMLYAQVSDTTTTTTILHITTTITTIVAVSACVKVVNLVAASLLSLCKTSNSPARDVPYSRLNKSSKLKSSSASLYDAIGGTDAIKLTQQKKARDLQ